jgi:hypothetical protein
VLRVDPAAAAALADAPPAVRVEHAQLRRERAPALRERADLGRQRRRPACARA